jgi:(p)ppGpp synthase/HD superfamily hydrolase
VHERHAGQRRENGARFVTHPVEVASILAGHNDGCGTVLRATIPLPATPASATF